MVSPEGAMRGMLEHLAPLREQIVKCEQSRSKVHRQAVFERIAAHHRSPQPNWTTPSPWVRKSK